MQSEYGIKSHIYFIVCMLSLQSKICALFLCSIDNKKEQHLKCCSFLLFCLLIRHFFTGNLLLKLGHKHGGEDTDDAEDNEDPANGRVEETHDVAAADT